MNERAVLPPALSDRYEIEREIGRGGMATVYLARDVKHHRRVAIKVLDAELGAVLGVERFLSEIRVTANLQHPNILPLFDSGEAAGLLYYVMPFVDGESLRTMLDRERQLPVDEAVRIAVAIANAVDYAHAHGVVHRDLKPENILLQSGQPIVADFGIALAVSKAGGTRVTQTGMALGTPQYMSPEQATGDRLIDARSDVYALGAMTYEMLAGDPPHTGSSGQAIVARILTERPRALRERRPSVPEQVDLAVLQAIEKLPADRFATAKGFADALEGRASVRTTGAAPKASRRARGTLLMVGVACIAALGASASWWRSAHAPPLPVANRFVVTVPPGVSTGGPGAGLLVALSRDGQSVAFSSSDGRLFIRRFDQLEPIPFPKVIAAGPEFHFSTDGKWLAYWSHGLFIAPVGPGDADAEPRRLVPANKLGAIAYFGSELIYLVDNAFYSIPASGGTPRKLASMDTLVDFSWSRPIMLPDGKTIAFVDTPGATALDHVGRLALISIDGGAPTRLDLEMTGVVGYVDGILVFTRTGRLLAVKFDASRRKVVGEPVDLVADHVSEPHRVTVSANGTLAYLADAPPLARLEIIDAMGNVSSSASDMRPYFEPVVSPDGKRIAITVARDAGYDVWIYDVKAGLFNRLTQMGADAPAWTPDSRRIAFHALDDRFFWMPADGSSAPEPIPGTANLEFPHYQATVQISPDDKYAVMLREGRRGEPATASRVTVVPLAGGSPISILEGAEVPHALRVSPNSNWLAYESRETGSHEVFIHSFPGGSAKLQISIDGGDEARWVEGGRKLVYRSGKQFREATLDFSGSAPRVVRTDTIFTNWNVDDRAISSYDAFPDGKHFVVMHPVGEATKLVVVSNWITEVHAKLAGK